MASSDLPLRLNATPALFQQLLPLLHCMLARKPLPPLQQCWLARDRLPEVDENQGLVSSGWVSVEAEDVAPIRRHEPSIHEEPAVQTYCLAAPTQLSCKNARHHLAASSLRVVSLVPNAAQVNGVVRRNAEFGDGIHLCWQLTSNAIQLVCASE